MSHSLSAPGLCSAVALHAVVLGMLLFAGTEETAVSASDADPILLMLGGEDPNKDAGLVGRERGVARGTEDGTIPEPDNDTSRLDAIREANERLAQEEAAAAERAAEEAARQAKAEAERRQREQAAAEAARQKAEQEARNKPKSANATPPANKPSGGSVDIRSLVRNNRDKGLYNKTNTTASSRRGNGNKPVRIGEVRVGRVGSGSVLGKPNGTGGNGGDGGKRVADARMAYVEAVRERFIVHFENVVAQNPPLLPNAVSVDARFSVSKSGEIRFLEIDGSNNSQIRECIRKVFRLAFPNRFQRPPGGEAFTGRLNNIEFLPQ